MVKTAELEDLDGINRIENAAIANGFAHFGISPLDLAETQTAFASKAERYPWLVKLIDGEVVGFARATPWKSREAYRWTCEIGVYVDEQFHRCGIGKELYSMLLSELERYGFHCVVAGITLPNEASIGLHESFGMKPVGTFPEMGFKLGEWRSVGYWAKVLNDAVPSAI